MVRHITDRCGVEAGRRTSGLSLLPGRLGAVASVALLGGALLACKQGEKATAGAEPTAAAAATSAAPVATAAPPAATSAPTPAAPAAKPQFKVGDVPVIPTERSNPPQGTEWDQGVAVNTQGANARGKFCSMRVLREWLNIYCTGKVIGYEKKEDFGTEGVDYFQKIAPGKFASFVIRLRPNHHPKIRICRENDRASLFVNWPGSKDRPMHIALGTGPVCDGSDWGVGYKKGEEQAAVRFKPEDFEISQDQIEANLKIQAVAMDACKEGAEDACMFACGSSSCP